MRLSEPGWIKPLGHELSDAKRHIALQLETLFTVSEHQPSITMGRMTGLRPVFLAMNFLTG